MSLVIVPPFCACTCFPRVSGDEPRAHNRASLKTEFSPREWG